MADARVSRTIKYCLGAAIAGRVLFPWLFGLLDNDGAILLAAARQQAADGLWSVNSPLHVWLTSICFRLFSVELWATRLVPMLAGVGAIALVHRQAAADGGEHAGIYAALLLAVTPVAAFYSCADVPYALLTFFGLLGLVLLTNAMSLEQAAPQGDRARTAESAWLGVAAGLAWAGAFACKTFAAVFIVPAIAALWPTVGNVAERRRGAWFPPLLAIASWAGVAAALTAWRWQTLGWSVIYDFQTDFRFDLLTQVFLSERWTDLVSLQAFALPLYAPALALAAARRDRPLFERLGWWFVGADLAVYFFNPVHHLPRALLPSAPLLAYLAGCELARARNDERRATLAAWSVVAAALLFRWATAVRSHLDPTWWTATGEIGGALLLFYAVRALPGRWFRIVRNVTAGALAISVTIYGLTFAYRNLDNVERNYLAQVDALRASGATTGVIGGGDVGPWLGLGEQCYPSLMDLPDESLRLALRDGLPAAMRALRVSAVIEDRRDQERTLAAFAAFAAQRGLAGTGTADPYPAVRRDPHAWRPFDNTLFAVYRLTDVPPPEVEAWPEWRRAEAPLDRTGLGVCQPTEARLAVVAHPSAGAPLQPEDGRLIAAEMTILPWAPADFDLVAAARDRSGRELWRAGRRLHLETARNEVGVPLARIAVDRVQTDADALVVPPEIAPIAEVEIRATPLDGEGTPLWVTVRTPDGW